MVENLLNELCKSLVYVQQKVGRGKMNRNWKNVYIEIWREKERDGKKNIVVSMIFFFLFSILFVESFYKCDSLYILLYFKVDIMQG